MRTAWVAAGLCLFAASAVSADEGDTAVLDLDLQALLQVQVTAQRRVENLQDVPMALTVLPGSQIPILGAAGDDLRFLSSRLPSLQIESSFGRTFPRIYIRGLGNTDFDLNASQPVSLVYDDVVQENPITKGFPLFDLAQVEMARGPQGTLFGRNAPAGVIKFESVRPSETASGYARLGWGRFGTGNLEAATGGALAPGLSARLSLLHQRRNDWVDNTRNGPGDDLEGYRETAARAQLLYSGREGFEALANLHVRSLDGSSRVFRANIIVPGDNRLVPGFQRDQVSQDGLNDQRQDQIGGSLRLRWDFERFSLHTITGYETAELDSRGDIDGGFGAVFAPPFGPGVIPFDTESTAAVPEHRQFTQELRVESRQAGALDWQAGLYLFDEHLRIEDTSFSSTAGGLRNGFSRQSQDNTAWAVFASAGWALHERFKLNGGLRYTHDRRDLAAQRFQSPISAIDNLGPLRAEASDSHLSWDASAVWKLDDRVNVYARVAEGFRAPSIQGRLLFNDSLSSARTETVISTEAGIKGEWFERRLRLGLGFYRYTLDNQQLTAVGGGANFNKLINADRVIGKGVELDLEAQVSERFWLSAGMSYNHTRIDDPDLAIQTCGAPCTVLDPTVVINGNTLALIDGNALPYAPRWIGTVSARYTFPLGVGDLYLHTDWAHRSRINLLLYRSREFQGTSLLEGGLRVGYLWQQGRRELAVFGRNITNAREIVGAVDFNNLTGTVNEPRIWGLEFKAGF